MRRRRDTVRRGHCPRRVGSSIAIVPLLVGTVCSACGWNEFTPPQDMAACSRLALAHTRGGSGDTDPIWHLAIDTTSHSLDEPITAYACLGPDDMAATVTVSEMEGVEVTPEDQRIRVGQTQPPVFEVSLVGDDDGFFKVTLDAYGSGGESGAYAEVHGDHWSLHYR